MSVEIWFGVIPFKSTYLIIAHFFRFSPSFTLLSGQTTATRCLATGLTSHDSIFFVHYHNEISYQAKIRCMWKNAFYHAFLTSYWSTLVFDVDHDIFHHLMTILYLQVTMLVWFIEWCFFNDLNNLWLLILEYTIFWHWISQKWCEIEKNLMITTDH